MQKYYSFVLLMLLGVSTTLSASKNCFPSKDCNTSVSGDCDESSIDFTQCSISTFIRPRSITNDLTYRNSNTFYQRFRGDASCAFFTFDSTFLYQENRKATRIGRGYFLDNPLKITQNKCAPFNSLNLGLESDQPEGFCSVVRLSPKRKVFAWMPQFIFKLDCFCTGVWADLAFAVTTSDHRVCLFEQVTTPGDANDLTTAQEAFEKLGVFPKQQSHTGVDDIQPRVGYLMNYCEDDMISFYVFGSIPTGKQFDNSVWMQPLVGTRNGGIGAGLMFDSTLWEAEYSEAGCLFMTEFKYLYRFPNVQRRLFDLKNGPLSRFLAMAPKADPNDDGSGLNFLRECVCVEPRSTIEWWMAFHLEYCSWGFELGYNIWWREKEGIKSATFDFDEHGIFDMTRTTGRTSHSDAKISTPAGVGTPDPTFVVTTTNDVLIKSAAGKKALSHTLSGIITYNNTWCDNPYSFAFGARYEFSGTKRHTSTFENWGVFGKLSCSY